MFLRDVVRDVLSFSLVLVDLSRFFLEATIGFGVFEGSKRDRKNIYLKPLEALKNHIKEP